MKITAIVISCLSTATLFAEDDVKQQLLERGVRVSSGSAVLAAESELSTGLKTVDKLRRDLITATKNYRAFKVAQKSQSTKITALNQRSVQLNAQLANVRTVEENNRLVGLINALNGQMRIEYDKLRKMEEHEKQAHGNVSQARDAFIAHVLNLRETADQVAEAYASPPNEVSNLLTKYNELAGTELKLEPTRSFPANVRNFEKIEGDILSEDIPLRREGNTYWAMATLNGEHAIELVVDSGASLISLPPDVAAKMKLQPGPDDPEIELVVADGRTISGHLMTLKSVRVGKFQLTDVECAVLGPEAINASPLLGMTFLGEFKFQLDGGKSVLSITQYDATELRPRNSRGR